VTLLFLLASLLGFSAVYTFHMIVCAVAAWQLVYQLLQTTALELYIATALAQSPQFHDQFVTQTLSTLHYKPMDHNAAVSCQAILTNTVMAATPMYNDNHCCPAVL
jgi:hypothetical protein